MNYVPSITFVCCVESGPLEVQTVRMIQSLRRWGGAFAHAPVVAVTPRVGPALGSATLAFFDQHNVQHMQLGNAPRYSWFKYYNKPLAVAAVESSATSESIAWLDSDVLVVREPELLRLAPDEDFAACASDKEMGTSGPEDPFDRIWRAECEAIGVDIDTLPFVVTELEQTRIRLYWNSGVFVYRKTTGFGQHFLDVCTKLLDARNRLAVKGFSISICEMGAVALAAHQLRLRHRHLPFHHNFIMNSLTHERWYREAQLHEARIVHYHDAMWPRFWNTLLACLHSTHPEVEAWLKGLGPMRNEATLTRRAAARLLRSWRDTRERSYVASCRPV